MPTCSGAPGTGSSSTCRCIDGSVGKCQITVCWNRLVSYRRCMYIHTRATHPLADAVQRSLHAAPALAAAAAAALQEGPHKEDVAVDELEGLFAPPRLALGAALAAGAVLAEVRAVVPAPPLHQLGVVGGDLPVVM